MRPRSGYAKVEPWTRRRIPAHTDLTTVADPLGPAAFHQERYMAYVSTAPSATTAAATQLEGSGNSFSAGRSAAAARTPAASN